jgi:hypothetical protein
VIETIAMLRTGTSGRRGGPVMRASHTAIFFTVTLLMPIAQFARAQSPSDNADGPFEVFLEPFGSETNGNAEFIASVTGNERLGSYETLTFDDFDAWPVNGQVPEVTADDVHLSIQAETSLGGAYVFRSPNYFYWENQIYGGTVVVATGATLAPLPGGAEAGAIGFWIFDDGKARDSIFLITVTDTCGNVVEAIVENDEPRIGGYEVEGFFGVTSEYGIVELVISVLDAETGEPWSEPLELDHLTVGQLHVPRSCTVDEPDEGEEADQDQEDDSTGRQCGSRRWRRGCNLGGAKNGPQRGCSREQRRRRSCNRNGNAGWGRNCGEPNGN